MSGKWESGLTAPTRDLGKPHQHVVRDQSGRTYPADLTHYWRRWDGLGGTIGAEQGATVDYPPTRVVIVAALIIAALVLLFVVA